MGESTLSPNLQSASQTPQIVWTPLLCFLPLTAPSCNSLLTMYCIGSKPKIETKAEVRLFRLKMTGMLPRWECPKEGRLSLTLTFTQPWHYQNGKLKRQDVPNLIKCCLDTIATRYRFDDSRIWSLTCQKAENGQVGIGIELIPLSTEKDSP